MDSWQCFSNLSYVESNALVHIYSVAEHPYWLRSRSQTLTVTSIVCGSLRYLAPKIALILPFQRICIMLWRNFTSAILLTLLSPKSVSISYYFLKIPTEVKLSKRSVSFQVPQVIMTALFGVYSTLIVLRSGHLIAACIVHSFCNAMGAPDIPGDLKAASFRDPRWGKRIYIALLVIGFIGWLLCFGPATTLLGFADTVHCRLFEFHF